MGQLENSSSVLDEAGSRSSGASFTNLSSLGQPGGISVSAGGGTVNYAGFFNTFNLRPNLDHDGDGLADESDIDNDNDTLADMAEVLGNAFDPITATEVNVPDSDQDGATDGAEAIAGTDPLNPLAFLSIVAFEENGSDALISWIARGGAPQGKQYLVKQAGDPDQLPGASAFDTNTAVGGSAPWYVVTNTYLVDLPEVSTSRFFTIEVVD